MWRKIALLFIFLSLSLPYANAQRKNTFKKDSLRVYRKIEDISKKNQVSKFIYHLFFRSLPSNEPPVPITEVKKKIIRDEYYRRFEGKVIRDIIVRTHDPFGYDHRDTSKRPKSILEKTGNALHVKTIQRTIKMLLLIKKHDVFDSLRVRESERLLRSQTFIHEVVFEPKLTAKKSDSVDIFIRVYDLWSIIALVDVSKSAFTLDLKDKSIMGLGHELQSVYSRNYAAKGEEFRANYYVPNIYDTYISAFASFDIDQSNNYNRGLSLNRPFYSAFAKWAGGASYNQHSSSGILFNADSTPINQKYRYDSQDYWAGKAWRILSGSSENERTTQLILSGRVLNVHYMDKPSAYFDSLNVYSNETFYLLATSLSRRRYDQDRYIFRYGNTEDVPVGKAYTITNGYQVKNNRGRYYLGAKVYWGQYYPWGYFSSSFEYGTFFYRSSKEEGSLTLGVNYFTNTFRIGKWKIRQFAKPQFTIGFNRPQYDNLSINNELGIRGFNSTGLSGNTQKVILTLQTQSYAPWNLVGFRFGPYLISSFGILGSDAGFRRRPVYSQFGIGFLIRNEYLIYRSLQISIAFYPTIPGIGNNLFKINPVKSTDFGFRDFDVGRPAPVTYQ